MVGTDINDNDFLIVDKRINSIYGKIVIAAIDRCLTLKMLIINEDITYFKPKNEKGPLMGIKRMK